VTKKKFLISLLAVIILAAGMLFTESKSGGEKGIIVKIELAPNIEEVQRLLAPFDEPHMEWLRQNTRLDFIFILTYTCLFYFAMKGWLERMGKWNKILLLAFLPGILDVVENLFILTFLNRDFATPYFTIYFWVVHLKWAFVTLFVLLSLLYLIRIMVGNKPNSANRSN
jgi:hypothetical protein